jgi:diaminohydroxyphosphoribosylaminopyrimidine deaminase / 5-amino-6-(5-phosphoribosylamino)uracil reductase
MIPHDETWMLQAIALAERGRGHVEPNPLVGALVVKDGTVVGSGWHRKYGDAHAEVNALTEAGEQARRASLYVTLEPCCHHGKTPPCTDAILRAGITRVVAAIEDPFPQVAGKGAAILRAAGVMLEFGPGAAQARRQNAPYLKLLSTGRPYVHAKWAMSLDGKIATRTGDSRWISNEMSRARVHELRGRMDGILVGIGTVLADDPLLTARPAGPRVPCRVILDTSARLHVDSQLVRTAAQTPTLLVTADAPSGAVAALRARGCEVLTLNADGERRPDLKALLKELGRQRHTNLLVEGGSTVLGAFFDQDLIDEAHVFIAPKIIGGAHAKTPVAGVGAAMIRETAGWITEAVERLGDDIYVRCIRSSSL